MIIEALLTTIGLTAGVGGALAVWQRGLARSVPPKEPENEAAPYRVAAQPGSARDEQSGGFPAPPPFSDD